MTTTETAIQNFIAAHLDMIEAAMVRWNCDPMTAIQILTALRDAS